MFAIFMHFKAIEKNKLGVHSLSAIIASVNNSSNYQPVNISVFCAPKPDLPDHT